MAEPKSRAGVWLKRSLLALAIGVGIALCILNTLIVQMVVEMVRGPEVVEHVTPHGAPYIMPSDATDVCYITRPAFWPVLAYEFTVSEESFSAWAKTQDYTMAEITEPFQINRYRFYAGYPDDKEATISNGLSYEKMIRDAGIYVAYDRSLKRAYVYAHSR